MRTTLTGKSVGAWGATNLARLRAVWSVLGCEVSRHAGLYLLDAYDPNKRPVVMIHGLGGSPLVWARLSNEIRSCPDLQARFQVWHVLYHASAPMLVIRRRVQRYLDETWHRLDPEGVAPARSGMVLIGHSLGGVVARMLCVKSGDALWSAAFTVSPEALNTRAFEGTDIGNVFRFQPYPGISRAIFMAAPHRGSPKADRWVGRFFRALIGGRSPEIQRLRRFARNHPDMVQGELREPYRGARVNSVASLQTLQPIRRAGESLMPASGIPYHVIAGVLPGSEPPGDGVVPLHSALLPDAASSLVVESGHDIYGNDQAIAEVLRILREDLMAPERMES